MTDEEKKAQEEAAAPEDAKAPEAKFTQADIDRVVKERLERERRKQADELAAAKAEAEKAALSEQGKYKELAEKAQQEANKVLADYKSLEAQLTLAKRQRAFELAVRTLGIEFASDAAREDAFGHLDPDVEVDKDGVVDAEVKRLMKERPYLFSKPTAGDIDATRTGRTGNSGTAINEGAVANKRKAGNYTGI